MQPIDWSEIASSLSSPIIDKMMKDALSIPGLLSLAAGFTDNAALPTEAIKKACDELLNGQNNACLQYGSNIGRDKLRKQALELLENADKNKLTQITDEQISITNGSQQALYISAYALCNPGDIVLIQNPSYFVFVELLRGLGIKAIGMPAKENGEIDIEKVKNLLKDWKANGQIKKLKLIYLCSYFANPSSLSMCAEEKSSFGKLLQELEIEKPILEDAAYRQLYYDSPCPTPSILSLKEFKNQSCLYCETFTKPFSTGLKVGFSISNNPEWPDMIRKIKTHQDFGTSHFNQSIIEYCIEHNLYEPHLKRIRKHYHEKMLLMHNTLIKNGLKEHGWDWKKPKGGLLFWIKAPKEISTSYGSSFQEECLKHKVIYVPGNICFAENSPHNFVRLSFGVPNNDDLIEANKRFCDAARKI